MLKLVQSTPDATDTSEVMPVDLDELCRVAAANAGYSFAF